MKNNNKSQEARAEKHKRIEKAALDAYSENKGVIQITGKVRIKSLMDLATYYTPGVSYPPLKIRANKLLSYKYTGRGNRIAIISNGSRILGLGNIGPEAGLPVMEGKSLLFKKFGNIDALPLAIHADSVEKIVAFAKAIQSSVGGINLEDISSPDCFHAFDRLQKELDIPVFHDDRQGTAVAADAALRNAMKIVDKDVRKAKIVINGLGAAGVGIGELLLAAGCKNLVMCDTRGILYRGRIDNMNEIKKRLAEHTNPQGIKGQLSDAVKHADVLIGASSANLFKPSHIKSMTEKPIVFALANPHPEIEHKAALDAGAYIVATGESDVPNQVNNLLAFPGIFRGALDVQARQINSAMLLEASRILAHGVPIHKRKREHIIPNFINEDINSIIANMAAGVAQAAMKTGVARVKVNPDEVRKNTIDALKRYSKLEKFAAQNSRSRFKIHLFK
ncbi:MAG: NADP-dependent malic enzyme [Candidatus Micrarchaeales archaeon]